MAVTMSYGAAPTYVKIASQTLASAAASVTFSNIPQGYTDLVIQVVKGNSANGTRDLQWKFNGDSGSNYSGTFLEGNGAAGLSSRDTNFTYLRTNGSSNNTPSNYTVINLMNYSNSTTFKTMSSISSHTNWVMMARTSLWRSTAAITSIVFTCESSNFVAGSTFTIYGIKAALTPKASGGDIIVQDGTYWYHAFRTTGAFVPRQSLTCDYLVVAGGGGAGSGWATPGGGGGAGGYLTSTGLSVSSATTVTIGAGGAGGAATVDSRGTKGSDSVFSVTATGGGYGAENQISGGPGGSGGGGAGGVVTTGGAASPAGQGNAGGGGNVGSNQGSGGGGGAGAAGGAGTTIAGGAGGAGLNTLSSWFSATGTGVNGYIAGGGGGSVYNGGTIGAGGAGGGGAGSYKAASNSGIANTGSGGGATGNDATFVRFAAGNGGSGLVIVRYPI